MDRDLRYEILELLERCVVGCADPHRIREGDGGDIHISGFDMDQFRKNIRDLKDAAIFDGD